MKEGQEQPAMAPESTAPEEKTAKKKPPLIMIGILVAILVVAVFASRLLVQQVFFPSAHEEKAEPKEKSELGEYHMITDLLINPAASGGRRHLLVSIGLEIHDPLLKEELAKRDPQIRDNLITLLAGQDASVLTDIRYREKIRNSLLKAVNYYLEEGQVQKLYFVKYVFQ
jgi:flagellar FliL protein